MQEGKFIQLKKARLTFINSIPPIIKMEAEPSEFLEIEDVKLIRAANLELSGNMPFCVLLDTSKGYFNISHDANKLLASKEYSAMRIGTAILAKSVATRLAGNFFITVNKPATPTKLFSTHNEAIAWLRQLA
ncbi:MAG: DUF7793 family protein [Bacteroidia bacterium]